ncbi:MAG: hypothetical protein ACK4MT_05015, partial [Thermaurantiacus tibetensis]
EMENMTWENASRLADAGVRVAFQGGYESYVPKARVVHFEAGVAAADLPAGVAPRGLVAVMAGREDWQLLVA